MAVTPPTDEAFLREVDEELRRDQLTSFWTRYGRWLLAGIGLALAVFGGVLYWQHRQTEAAGVQGEQLSAAIDDLTAQKTDAAAVPLETLAGSDVGGIRASAKFSQGNVLLAKNDLKGAAAKFGEIAADTSLAQPFRDLALIRQTSAEFDTLKPDMVVTRLKPLVVKGNPWFGSAGELVAAAYLEMNRKELAGPLFAQIAKEETVPASIRQRAVQMAGVLGIDAVDTVEEKKAP
ncbi:hypothetical protein ASG11_13625 [Sphingomonas sp. Leaf357]|uniref:tetratricopeptide repeat protein n=1 Tax=Sphingomonas sp. Leaf357 TaxID=1736350 RepID=UPI0006F23D37|nr:tetratricopeptide repeat protein [Sphingomonas sp. Leaf357]KQS01861.1 hypothetical protein ASG11_13625 [Sphingomonas sp. Leaf357]